MSGKKSSKKIAKRRKEELSNDERTGIIRQLNSRLDLSNLDNILKRGACAEVACIFDVHQTTVRRVWERAINPFKKEKAEWPNNFLNAQVVEANSRKHRCGRRKKWTRSIFREAIRKADKNKRRTYRSTSNATGIPIGTIFRAKKKGWLKPNTNAVKPHLDATNRDKRSRFAAEHLLSDGMYHDMMDEVHVDEKWFFIIELNGKFYLLPDEEEPLRQVKSKRYVMKVMFLCAIARPRWDPNKKQWWDGKIGMWPFTYKKAAERTSKNRPVGTMETKAMNSVGKKEYREMIVDKVVPAIKAQWLPAYGKRVRIQQDGAKVHINNDDPDFVAVARVEGWEILIVFQPPNSPDNNINDLAFFHAIQALQWLIGAHTIEELVAAVEKAFDEYPREKINKMFITLQTVYEQILLHSGGNKFRIPHLGKDPLARRGTSCTKFSTLWIKMEMSARSFYFMKMKIPMMTSKMCYS